MTSAGTHTSPNAQSITGESESAAAQQRGRHLLVFLNELRGVGFTFLETRPLHILITQAINLSINQSINSTAVNARHVFRLTHSISPMHSFGFLGGGVNARTRSTRSGTSTDATGE
ncbi:Uncharacterized protein HZ326_22305 [Fusarium oxysporum f. sp. albedinis]|nr:Uncharacterized protein HZ326_22305 [Fusarium oxysporum f. sp. albedinis]